MNFYQVWWNFFFIFQKGFYIYFTSTLKYFFFCFRSRRGSPVCITPKGNCPTSPVDPPKVIQPTTERATGEPGAVQPGPPRCTWNAANKTASQHLCESPGERLPRHGHPSSLLAADPGPNCPGILIRAERPNTSRFGTFSTPTCCPESSPSWAIWASHRHRYPSCKHDGVPLVTTVNSGSPGGWADGVGVEVIS